MSHGVESGLEHEIPSRLDNPPALVHEAGPYPVVARFHGNQPLSESLDWPGSVTERRTQIQHFRLQSAKVTAGS